MGPTDTLLSNGIHRITAKEIIVMIGAVPQMEALRNPLQDKQRIHIGGLVETLVLVIRQNLLDQNHNLMYTGDVFKVV